jgi:hypothetical protein
METRREHDVALGRFAQIDSCRRAVSNEEVESEEVESEVTRGEDFSYLREPGVADAELARPAGQPHPLLPLGLGRLAGGSTTMPADRDPTTAVAAVGLLRGGRGGVTFDCRLPHGVTFD